MKKQVRRRRGGTEADYDGDSDQSPKAPEASPVQKGDRLAGREAAAASDPEDKRALRWEKFRKMRTRSVVGVTMMSLFAMIVYAGHFYCMLLVVALLVFCFNEVVQMKLDKEKEMNLPLLGHLRWYAFSIAVFFGTVTTIPEQIDNWGEQNAWVKRMKLYSLFVTYCLSTVFVVAFHLSLRNFTLRYQFHQLSWVLCTLVAVVMQAFPMVYNIYRGLIWFVLPMSVVIVNDIAAYFSGTFFGKTKLISLSPNKTWEGFIGGALLTVLFGIFFAGKLQGSPHFTCPQPDLILTPFRGISCPPSPTFTPTAVQLVGGLSLTPMQLHGAAFAVFASTIGPFGGFFASGFKRAFKVKDFAAKFPGHGGVMDRVDCMVVMGLFSFAYTRTVVPQQITVESMVERIDRLSVQEQLQVYKTMAKALASRRLLNG
jgi:phosphatidate cytidylyltransferase